MQREREGLNRRRGGDEPFDRVAAAAKARARKPASAPRPKPTAVREAQAAGRARFLEAHNVSRETLERLDRFVVLLTEWQARINLVAPATLGEVWDRHIGDSLVLERLLPPFERAIDLGSGGGLPGLIVAAARVGDGGVVDLVESNGKKAAFLRTVQRELGLPGTVHAARIETCGVAIAAADVVTARALAALDELCGLVGPHLKRGARCFFQKGRSHEQEIAAATAHWRFTMLRHPTGLADDSVVLELAGVEPASE